MPTWVQFTMYLVVIACAPPVLLHAFLDGELVRTRMTTRRERVRSWLGRVRPRLAGRRRREPVVQDSAATRPRPYGPPRAIELLAADLRRLSVEIDRASASDRLPGRMMRLQAATLAYDTTLINACLAVGVDAEVRAPMRDVERLQVEADLAQAGMSW